MVYCQANQVRKHSLCKVMLIGLKKLKHVYAFTEFNKGRNYKIAWHRVAPLYFSHFLLYILKMTTYIWSDVNQNGSVFLYFLPFGISKVHNIKINITLKTLWKARVFCYRDIYWKILGWWGVLFFQSIYVLFIFRSLNYIRVTWDSVWRNIHEKLITV